MLKDLNCVLSEGAEEEDIYSYIESYEFKEDFEMLLFNDVYSNKLLSWKKELNFSEEVLLKLMCISLYKRYDKILADILKKRIENLEIGEAANNA